MMEPALVILAAGIGSRYGGMKQIDGVGNHGEPIIEFSIYDAYRAGFKKVILIIKPEHEDLFRKCLTDRIAKKMEVGFAYQELADLPEGFHVPEGRTKPWGTTHALWACRNVVKEPFMIINADDFYGRHAYETMYRFLTEEVSDHHYAMVGWQCRNTLTDNGTVTRGLCKTDENGYLTDIEEVKQIARKNGQAVATINGEEVVLAEDVLVSMNYWGFTPAIFKDMEAQLSGFLSSADAENNPMKCEHVIPTAIGDMIHKDQCRVKVLSSSDDWFGVTYQEDKPYVVKRIQELKNENEYPDIVWD